MASSLEEVAAAAEEAARDKHEVARRARAMQRKRDRGWSWSRILEAEGSPSVIEIVRRGAQRAAEAKTTLATVLARELSREGLSRRQIAQRLHVTHQRVSAMLNRHNGSPTNG